MGLEPSTATQKAQNIQKKDYWMNDSRKKGPQKIMRRKEGGSREEEKEEGQEEEGEVCKGRVGEKRGEKRRKEEEVAGKRGEELGTSQETALPAWSQEDPAATSP